MSFWYHLPFNDLAEMPITAMQAYLQRLPARISELKLVLSQVVLMPWMDAADRQNHLRNWQEESGRHDQVKPATPEILVMVGIGIRHE